MIRRVKRDSGFGAFGSRASAILIVAALLALGVMQYQWFSRSASAEVADAAGRISVTAAQTLSREYQRYAPLLGELRSLRARPGESRESLQAFLARAYETYGPEGITPRLLRAVSLIDMDGPDSMRTYDPSERAWRSWPDLIDRSLSDRALAALRRGEIGFFGTGNGRRFFLAAAGQRYVLALEVDTEGFFDKYAAPALAAALPGAILSWSEESARPTGIMPGAFPVPGMMEAPRSIAFNPFRALAGGSKDEAFRMDIPLELLSFYPRGAPDDKARDQGPGRWDAPEPGKPSGPPREPAPIDELGPKNGPAGEGFRLMPIGAMEGPGSGRSRALSVVLPASSSLGSIERRLALNWCLGNLLLVGVGLAFFQAVRQRRKLSVLRLREREFVAAVTHELRTPLTVIVSAADNLKCGLVSGERVAEYGELIAGQSQRLGGMIEKVLLYSKVEDGVPSRPEPLPTSPGRLGEALRGELEELARSSGCSLEWDLGGLPPSFLGDIEGIGTVLSNLVANAACHAYGRGAGGPVRVKGSIARPDRLVISVEDEGRGIPRSEAELVFAPFYRDGAARERADKGTGLGLFIARRLARAMGGELGLESPYRRADGARSPGCRFALELPFKEANDVA
jgi:signal transduction histidine kinase/type II secretory pathway pseudopilin PulG